MMERSGPTQWQISYGDASGGMFIAKKRGLFLTESEASASRAGNIVIGGLRILKMHISYEKKMTAGDLYLGRT